MLRLQTTFSTLLLFCIMLFSGCTFTTTLPKQPVFNKNLESIRATMDSMVTCEHINVDGNKVTTNGKTEVKLDIAVINGSNLPMTTTG